MSVCASTAAENTLERLSVADNQNAQRNKYGEGVPHAVWMLIGVAQGYIQNDKAQRWLGYAQGLLKPKGHITLEGCKTANKEASL